MVGKLREPQRLTSFNHYAQDPVSGRQWPDTFSSRLVDALVNELSEHALGSQDAKCAILCVHEFSCHFDDLAKSHVQIQTGADCHDGIKERIDTAAFDIALKKGDIELVPFEVMRGRSWKNAFVLLDEAQNTTVDEIKMFLTRIGDDCTVVINGDVSQCDIDHASGLRTVIHLIKSQMLNVPVIEFTRDDIVRSGVCAMWVRAFDEAKL